MRQQSSNPNAPHLTPTYSGVSFHRYFNTDMKLKKVGGVYHAQFKTAAGKRTQVTTRCSDRSEAERVVKEAGIKDMEMAAKAGRLSRQAIGHIVAGRKTTIAKEI